MNSRIILTLLLAQIFGGAAWADKNVELKPVLATAGKTLFESAFDGGALEKPWTAPKGDWAIVAGSMVGKEKSSDMHPAVLALGLPNHDSLIRFSFKLDGVKSLSLSFNHAKGHLFRVNVSPALLSLNKDKDKADTESKGEVMAKAAATFAPGQWYTMLVEIKGPKVSVQTDNGARIEASQPALDVQKTGYRFVTRGESLLIDDLKVWESAAP